MINTDLQEYIKEEIIPLYKRHDDAHDERHAMEVIDGSFEIASLIDEMINPNILYTAAAFHDVGLIYGRKVHHMESGKRVRNTSRLKEWFYPEEIEMIAQACEDHRASLKGEPRSIYGKLVGDGDRVSLFDVDRFMERVWDHNKDYLKEDFEGFFEKMYDHLYSKFSTEKGYMTFHFKETERKYRNEIKTVRELVDDRDRLCGIIVDKMSVSAV